MVIYYLQQVEFVVDGKRVQGIVFLEWQGLGSQVCPRP